MKVDMFKGIIAFDIETVGNKEVLEIDGILPEFKAASNVKDPAKIEAQKEAKKKKFMAELGLDSNFGKIVCIGFANDEIEHTFTGDDERALLGQAWAMLEDYDEIVGFNSKNFDLPWLLRRSWYCGVEPTNKYDLLPYRTQNHYDLRLLLSHGNRMAKGKLWQFVKIKLGIDIFGEGSEVQAMYDAGKFDEIAEHCLDDVKATWKLFKTMGSYYF